MTDVLDEPEPALSTLAEPAAPPAGIATSGDEIGLSDDEVGLLVPTTGRTIVVVPHPHDEVLTTGGLIAHQRARGREVVVVAVTDGHLHEQDGFGRMSARRREQLAALERLGVGRGSVHRLEIPGGEVSTYVDDVVVGVAHLVGPHDVIVAPAVSDPDPDHAACGHAATAVAARVGCDVLGSVSPARVPAHPAPPGTQFASLPLTGDDVARRRAAFACHPSRCAAPAGSVGSADAAGVLDRPVEYYLITLQPPGEPG